MSFPLGGVGRPRSQARNKLYRERTHYLATLLLLLLLGSCVGCQELWLASFLRTRGVHAVNPTENNV